jgi:hypothetical protein
MAGLMVHGIFWNQFLNGLRFLTLVYVCLWTALATTGNRSQESEFRSQNGDSGFAILPGDHARQTHPNDEQDTQNDDR